MTDKTDLFLIRRLRDGGYVVSAPGKHGAPSIDLRAATTIEEALRYLKKEIIDPTGDR